MYVDKELELADAQALSAVGDNVTTEVIDTAVVDRNIGMGEPMAMYFGLDVLPDVADGNETYEFRIEAATDEAFTTPVIIATKPFTNTQAAALTTADKIVLNFPNEPLAEQFIRGNVFTAGTTPAVTVTVFVTENDMIQNEFRKGQPSGFVVA